MTEAEKNKKRVLRKYILFMSVSRGRSKKQVINFVANRKKKPASKDNQLQFVLNRVFSYLKATATSNAEYRSIPWVLKIVAQKAYPPYLKNCSNADFKRVKSHLREHSKVTLQLVGVNSKGVEVYGPRVRIVKKG